MKPKSTKGMVPVDGDILRALFKKKGKTQSDVSQEMGHGYSYLSQRLARGELYSVDAVWIETVMGIKPEQYAPKLTSKESVDLVNVRAAMRGVVKDAINERFSNAEFVEALRDIIRPAVRQLLEEERQILAKAAFDAVREALE